MSLSEYRPWFSSFLPGFIVTNIHPGHVSKLRRMSLPENEKRPMLALKLSRSRFVLGSSRRRKRSAGRKQRLPRPRRRKPSLLGSVPKSRLPASARRSFVNNSKRWRWKARRRMTRDQSRLRHLRHRLPLWVAARLSTRSLSGNLSQQDRLRHPQLPRPLSSPRQRLSPALLGRQRAAILTSG